LKSKLIKEQREVRAEGAEFERTQTRLRGVTKSEPVLARDKQKLEKRIRELEREMK
jgi:hypothetical protein